MDKLIRGIAVALDAVEQELLGATTNHGKRIAALCAVMGNHIGMGQDETRVLTTCALLHDNALTEYIREEVERPNETHKVNLHCEYGERNIASLKLHPDSTNMVRYHHERADGLGAYGKKEGEIPLGAELIAIADVVDVKYHLQHTPPELLGEIHAFIKENAGTWFSRRAAEALRAVLTPEILAALNDQNIVAASESFIPHWTVDFTDLLVMDVADFAVRIIDYKSKFTRKHTAQIASRTWIMAEYYGYDKTLCAELYSAAALHDIGKLMIPSAILEKPGALTAEEFQIIKSHVYKTWEILKDIDGFGQICAWAANHHEKLDGTGYPFGKNAADIDFPSRLIACLDVYQAVSEERPYHAGRSHESTIAIMRDMAEKNCIDGNIVSDVDAVMRRYTQKDVPHPLLG
jgi:HD-GYP domain-containing protein (c-di-GMP phosphodiesterase class II)